MKHANNIFSVWSYILSCLSSTSFNLFFFIELTSLGPLGIFCGDLSNERKQYSTVEERQPLLTTHTHTHPSRSSRSLQNYRTAVDKMLDVRTPPFPFRLETATMHETAACSLVHIGLRAWLGVDILQALILGSWRHQPDSTYLYIFPLLN